MHKIKYLTKNAVALANSISVMHAVMTHLDKNVSTAGDAQTDPIMHQVKTMVERYYNSLNTLQEIGLQQAVASIFGQGSWSSTEQFTYCYIKPALAYVRGLLSSSSYVSDDNGLSEDADDSTDEYEDDISSDNGVDRDDTSAEVAGPDDGQGSAFIYTTNSVSTGQKELVATPQHIHYALRGAFLDMLNLNEYVSCVEVVLRPSWSQRPALPMSLLDDSATCPGNGETIEEANENEDGDGTPLSTTVKRRERHSIYNFDCRHPLYQTHVQRLRAKQLTTIKAGARPPKYPGRRKKGRSTHWTAVAHSFAEYVLVLYKPWNYDDLVLNRLRLSWRALGDWIHHDLDPPYPDYLTRYRKETTFSTIPDNGATMQTSETRISDVARVLRNKPPNGESPKELPQNATPIIATPYIQRYDSLSSFTAPPACLRRSVVDMYTKDVTQRRGDQFAAFERWRGGEGGKRKEGDSHNYLSSFSSFPSPSALGCSKLTPSPLGSMRPQDSPTRSNTYRRHNCGVHTHMIPSFLSPLTLPL